MNGTAFRTVGKFDDEEEEDIAAAARDSLDEDQCIVSKNRRWLSAWWRGCSATVVNTRSSPSA